MSARDLALNLLIKAKDMASKPLTGFRSEVQQAGEQAEQLGESLDKTAAQTGNFSDQLNEADKAAGRFYDKQGRLREATGRFVQGAARATDHTRNFKGQLTGVPGAASAAERGIGSLTKRVIALAGAYLGINALKNALLGLVNVGSRFEDMQVQINTLMGSIEAGEQAVAWIKEFAATTPADIEGVTQGFIKLKAFGIDPMNGSYQAIIDQTAKLGFSQEKLDGIVLAVGQAWTKQKLQGEEALQLIERGVPVWDLLAKATGRNTVELQDLASAGQLGRREITLLIQEMGKASEGAAASAMGTWTGLVSNLKDIWLNFINDINEAGFLDYLKDQLKALLDQVKAMAADGSLKRWAKDISDSLISVAEGFKSVVQWTVDWGKQLGYLVGAIAALKLAQLITNLAGVARGMKGAALATVGMTAATEGLAGASAKAGKGWGWLKGAGAGLKTLGGYLVSGGRLLTGLGLLAGAVKLVADRWRESERAEADALSSIQQRALSAIEAQQKYLDAMNTQIKTEAQLGVISREGYDAYALRLQNAQAYWQARIAEEQAEIEQGRQRQAQLAEAQAKLAEYQTAQETLKATITDVNALQSQGLQEGAAGLAQQTDQTNTQVANLTELGAVEQQLADEREAATKAQAEAWKGLGLDIKEVTGTITEQGQKAIDSFALIVESGNYTGDQLKAAFDGALANTRTKADVEALVKVLEVARKKGDITGDAFKSAFEAASGKIKDAGKAAKETAGELQDLNNELKQTGKIGAGAISELIKTVRELVSEVRELAGEFRKAGQEAEKMAKSAEGAGQGDQPARERHSGVDSVAEDSSPRYRSMSSQAADKLRAQGRDDAAEILLRNIAQGKVPQENNQGLIGWKRWWTRVSDEAIKEADAIRKKYAELARFQRAIAAGEEDAAKAFLKRRESFADLEGVDLVGIVSAASSTVKERQKPVPQLPVLARDRMPIPSANPQIGPKMVRVEFAVPGRRPVTGDFAEGSTEQLLGMLSEVASVTR